MGLSARDLSEYELVHRDPEYQLTIAIRAIKTPDKPKSNLRNAENRIGVP